MALQRLIQIHGYILRELVAVADVVEVAVVLHELIGKLLDAVDVEEITDRAVFEDHLAVRIELVVAGAHRRAVGIGMALQRLVQVQRHVSGELAAVADVIVITLVLAELIGVHRYAVLVEAVVVGPVQELGDAVGTAVIVDADIAVEEVLDAGLHVAVAVEEVGLAVDLIGSGRGRSGRGILVVAGAVPVAQVVADLLPGAVGQTSLLEHELDRAVSLRLSVNAFKSGRIEVIPLVIDRDPAADELAAGSIVVLAVNHLQTGHGSLHAAGLADELVAGDHKLVTRRGNGGAPVNDRVAAFAEGAAGVAVLSAGGRLVLDGGGIMNVRAAMGREVGRVHVVAGGIHLGGDAELLVGEGSGGAVSKGDDTLVDIQLQIVTPELVRRPVLRGGLAGDMDIVVIVEDANGDLRQHRFAGQIVVTGTGEGDRGGIGLLVNGVVGGEAFCQHHVIKLPVVDAVHVDDRFNGLDLLDIGGNEIHPVDGAEEDSVERRVGGNQLHGGSAGAGLDLEHADHDRGVARVVGDLELHAVVTVGNLDVGRRHDTVCIGRRNLNAVDEDLGGGGVDAGGVRERVRNLVRVNLLGCVSDIGGEGQRARRSGADLVLDKRGAVHIDLVELGLLSVVNSLRVVNGDVVEIEGVGANHGAAVQNRVVLRSGEDERQEEIALFA